MRRIRLYAFTALGLPSVKLNAFLDARRGYPLPLNNGKLDSPGHHNRMCSYEERLMKGNEGCWRKQEEGLRQQFFQATEQYFVSIDNLGEVRVKALRDSHADKNEEKASPAKQKFKIFVLSIFECGFNAGACQLFAADILQTVAIAVVVTLALILAAVNAGMLLRKEKKGVVESCVAALLLVLGVMGSIAVAILRSIVGFEGQAPSVVLASSVVIQLLVFVCMVDAGYKLFDPLRQAEERASRSAERVRRAFTLWTQAWEYEAAGVRWGLTFLRERLDVYERDVMARRKTDRFRLRFELPPLPACFEEANRPEHDKATREAEARWATRNSTKPRAPEEPLRIGDLLGRRDDGKVQP